MPTILHISTRLILGGSQENTVLSCEGQARRGDRVFLAYGPIYGPEGSMQARVMAFNERCRRGEERAEPIGLVEVPSLVREVDPVRDWRCLGELRAVIEKIDPDVVHTHSSKAGILGRIAGWRVRRARRDGRPRVVHTIHGPPFMPVEGGVGKRLKRWLSNWVYEIAEKHAANRCDVIVSVADAMTRDFLARGIGRAEQYVTVRSGMETGPYLEPRPGETRSAVRASLGIAESDFIVGTVARLAEHKGHDDLLDALAGVIRGAAEGKRLRLLWVGDGWWRERLTARAKELGLRVSERDTGVGGADGDIVITGLVGPERIPGLMRAMDVLAHPSYREGLPRTVPQALLAGTFPVAYNADGTGEVCRDMETGRLVGVGDVAGLRDAIVWAMEHEAERSAMVERGRALCAEWFRVERMVDGLGEVYWEGTEGEGQRDRGTEGQSGGTV